LSEGGYYQDFWKIVCTVSFKSTAYSKTAMLQKKFENRQRVSSTVSAILMRCEK
jgi:hypothetical protein